jgi:hypothetical protein
MSDEKSPQPIGEPEAMDHRERRVLGKDILTWLAVVAGGAVAFSALLTPTQTRGATRSSKLRWEERRNEIRQTIDSTNPVQSNDCRSETNEQSR